MITDRERELIAAGPRELFIAGQWREAAGGRTFAVEDPATGEILTTVADASAADGAAALAAAVAAQADWAVTAPQERADILLRAHRAVLEQIDDLALVMTLEMGKPLDQARGEIAYGAGFLRWFAEEAARIAGRYSLAPDGRTRHLVHRRPVGPCLLITPWNFPLAMAARKIAPAVAAGCTVVLKPSELTPLTSLALTRILIGVGLPAGVLNVVPTTDPGALTGPLLADPRLRKLSFTGSTGTGRHLLRQAAAGVLRTSMELGGNAPFLVFEDADLEAAVAGAVQAKLRNMGEACTAANRFLVHESVAGEFAQRLSGAFSALTMGRGTEAGVDVGPLVDERSRDKVHALVQDALERGARALTGGRVPAGAGHFYPPTVLVDVPLDARLGGEEIFGPVAPISTFRDEDEAVALANATEYGLAAYAFTRDLERTLRLTEQIEAGMLGINTGLISDPAAPFGGIKQSGLGREGGLEGLGEYLDVRFVALATAPAV